MFFVFCCKSARYYTAHAILDHVSAERSHAETTFTIDVSVTLSRKDHEAMAQKK